MRAKAMTTRTLEGNKTVMGWLARQLDSLITEMDLQISATPTGERRNELCDANIHLREALRLVVEGKHD